MSTTLVPNRTEVRIDDETLSLWLVQGVGRGRYSSWDYAGIRDAVEAVNRGAQLLDEKRPDWVGKIIPENLDMSDASLCIIGQTYGQYEAVGIPFGMDVMAEDYDVDEFDAVAVDHGFLSGVGYDEEEFVHPYPLLDRVWVYLLHERHARKTPVFLTVPDLN